MGNIEGVMRRKKVEEELILKQGQQLYKSINSLTALALQPSSPWATAIEKLGEKIVEHVPGRENSLVQDLKKTGCDTMCLVLPSHDDSLALGMELAKAAKKAGVSNVLLISSAGAEYATKEKQPLLHQFIELENAVLSAKGDPDVATSHSACVIRAGFFVENFRHRKIQNVVYIPLPIGQNDKFAPVALCDFAHIAALVPAGQGKHGFDDHHHGQVMTVTGSLLCEGKDVAAAASNVFEPTAEHEEVSQAEAERFLKSQPDLNPSEFQYIVEYYSLVREGRPTVSNVAENLRLVNEPQLKEFARSLHNLSLHDWSRTNGT